MIYSQVSFQSTGSGSSQVSNALENEGYFASPAHHLDTEFGGHLNVYLFIIYL